MIGSKELIILYNLEYTITTQQQEPQQQHAHTAGKKDKVAESTEKKAVVLQIQNVFYDPKLNFINSSSEASRRTLKSTPYNGSLSFHLAGIMTKFLFERSSVFTRMRIDFVVLWAKR
jgi:hypothetical protein